MTTTLTAIGGYGLVIDKKILERLRISPDTELVVSVVRGCIVIAPSDDRSSTTTRLTTIGDGYGVIIDGKIIAQLGISSNTKLDISADGRRIVVKPIKQIAEPRRQPAPEPALASDCSDARARARAARTDGAAPQEAALVASQYRKPIPRWNICEPSL